MFATVTKSERSGPVFCFFMDLGMQEKPHLFQFVPREKQVKAENKLLKTFPEEERQKVEGVPVFSAQNLDIAVATSDGIKWYTSYFFDKGVLDNVLEGSVDQYFEGLVDMRNMQRRRDVIDDSMESSMPEEITENILNLQRFTKAAEIELLFAVDRVLLGNRWLRKATGIQLHWRILILGKILSQAADRTVVEVATPSDEFSGSNNTTMVMPSSEGDEIIMIEGPLPKGPLHLGSNENVDYNTLEIEELLMGMEDLKEDFWMAKDADSLDYKDYIIMFPINLW